jgi:phage shock protein A
MAGEFAEVLAFFLLRLAFWVGIPLALLCLALGPARLRRAWAWLTDRRRDPAAVFNQVVSEHQKKIQALRQVLKQAEATLNEIAQNARKSEDNIAALEREAREQVERDDDLGARSALSKLNLERLAAQGFREQHAGQRERVNRTRRRLHLLELQLRQYEVGRSILLTQLAEAKTVEQQYALANQFDPFSAVAAWKHAEGDVQEAAQHARAAEQVYHDTADLPLNGQPLRVEADQLEAQLAELKAKRARK